MVSVRCEPRSHTFSLCGIARRALLGYCGADGVG
jgi:hypothetical protein